MWGELCCEVSKGGFSVRMLPGCVSLRVVEVVEKLALLALIPSILEIRCGSAAEAATFFIRENELLSLLVPALLRSPPQLPS